MTLWTFIWLMVLLKLPIVALFAIVRWAVGQEPEVEPGQDGGIGPRTGPQHPHRPRSRWPRPPRRGPHRGPAPAVPARVRAPAPRRRLPQR
ncbi:MAG TPA: hypothetical protein VKV16_09345 [Solirubrobacteraceae bacterium]|nr:hypothetical protein [Solirubrobacteraceae bacterium]